MDLRDIIDEIANQADDFLANAADRREARAAVAELIASTYPDLSERARHVALDGVMHILEEEAFFGAAGGLDAPDDGEDDEED
jgi:hypothetical protein